MDSREVARNSRARKNWSKRAEGGLGKGSLRCERTISTDQKGTACSLFFSQLLKLHNCEDLSSIKLSRFSQI